MSTPTLDRDAPHATIYGSGDPHDAGPQPKYHQSGNYFMADGSFHSSDGMKPVKVVAPVVAADPEKKAEKQTLPGVSEEEAAELLKDPRADELLAMPRDKVMALVEAAGGPLVAGPGSHGNMVAFLIKHTRPDSDEL